MGILGSQASADRSILENVRFLVKVADSESCVSWWWMGPPGDGQCPLVNPSRCDQENVGGHIKSFLIRI